MGGANNQKNLVTYPDKIEAIATTITWANLNDIDWSCTCAIASS